MLLHFTVFLVTAATSRGDPVQACQQFYLFQVGQNGVQTAAFDPIGAAYGNLASAFRPYNGIGGVQHVNSTALACGYTTDNTTESPPVSGYLSATAGSVLDLQYRVLIGGFPGPFSAWIASCGDDCSKVQSSAARWLKVAGDSYSAGQYGTQRLISHGDYNLTIPPQLAAGDYLIRLELLDFLHSVSCPICFQLQINGTTSCSLPTTGLVSFPGAYVNDTALQGPATGNGYVPPGPPISTFCGNTNIDPNTAFRNGSLTAPPDVTASDRTLALSLGGAGAGVLLLATLLICCWCRRQRRVEERADSRAAQQARTLASSRQRGPPPMTMRSAHSTDKYQYADYPLAAPSPYPDYFHTPTSYYTPPSAWR